MKNSLMLAAALLLASYSNLMIKARAMRVVTVVGSTDNLSYIIRMAMDPWIWSSCVAFGSATLLWLLVIRQVDLSIALPIMALNFVIVPLSAALLFGEPMSLSRAAGLMIIMFGVYLAARPI